MMIQLEEPHTYSPAGLGMALYEKVQEMTEGKARKAAALLSAITCLELDGRDVPVSAWCTLVLIALSDLALHAPRMTLVICNWSSLYDNIARCSGEMPAQQMAASLAWAMSRGSNLCLEPPQLAVVNNNALPAAAIRIAAAA